MKGMCESGGRGVYPHLLLIPQLFCFEVAVWMVVHFLLPYLLLSLLSPLTVTPHNWNEGLDHVFSLADSRV